MVDLGEACIDHFNDLGAAFGEGSGLVEGYRVDCREALEDFATFDEQTRLRSAADGDGDGCRYGQAHRAGARDDEDRDGDGERAGEAFVMAAGVFCDGPDGEGEGGEYEDGGDEDGAGAVGEALHGGSAGLGLREQALHLGERGGYADGCCAENEWAVEVEGSSGDAVADVARDGEGLAGEHGLVDGAAAVEDEAVEGDAVAGKDADEVVGLDGGEGKECFGRGGVVGGVEI